EEEPLIVMNGDILSAIDFGELVDFHAEGGFAATLCARSHRVEVPFGVIQMESGLLHSIVEKPVYNNMISAGMYVLNPEALADIPKNTVTDMPNLLMQLVNHRSRVGVYSLDDDWVDVGRHDDLERARKAFAGAA
ncbi:MAG: hypothetical protein K2Q01_04135, partial [Rickettsiales bacterium]|nr:hypothetical protein [Rickettsiales bacterium]